VRVRFRAAILNPNFSAAVILYADGLKLVAFKTHQFLKMKKTAPTMKAKPTK
jgi:hypothetical protein